MTDMKPASRPACANFSSGPCAKFPGWTPEKLKDAVVGRSHRSSLGKARLKKAIDLTREVLQVPDDYKIGIVPASDTGAVEMALWSLLGERPVDVVAWESFGDGWVSDILKQLKLKDARKIVSGYGDLPDLAQINFAHDVVFTWNGTTSGVRVPNADFIPANRAGLTICDATSSAFAQEMDFTKLDVVTFSWQKVLGGEGAHGVLILSPRAVARLESYTPPWPMPRRRCRHRYSAQTACMDSRRALGPLRFPAARAVPASATRPARFRPAYPPDARETLRPPELETAASAMAAIHLSVRL